MTDALLFRLAGCAAMLAGTLRVCATFLPQTTTSSVGLEWLYLLIDVAIAFALVGIYAYQRVRSGVLGFRTVSSDLCWRLPAPKVSADRMAISVMSMCIV